MTAAAERSRNRVRLFVVLVAFAATVAAGCRVHRAQDNHEREQILYTANPGDPRTFNPILITDATSGEMTNNLFEGLIRVNPITTLPEPGLAEKWDISADQKTITFHLRHGVKWWDGQPFTASDVLFTMKVIYDPNVPNSMRPGLLVDGKPIKVDAPDDYTVVITSPRVFAPLIYAIAVPIIPEHALKAAHDSGKFNQTWGINTPPDQIIGLGSFKMTRYVPSQAVQYARNPDFWMKDEHGGVLPRLHGQTITIVQDQNAAYLRFLSGQVDIHSPRPEEVIDLRDKVKQLDITLKDIGIDTGTLFFSFNRNPRHFIKNGVTDPKLDWFTDPKFLQAMAHAIDKKAIVDLCFHGMGEPAVADISPANKIFHNPNLKDYDYDLKLSAQMLEAGGYHLVKPGVRADVHGNPLVFNLTTNTNSPERIQICTIFKQDLESLGIKVNFRPLEFTTLVDKLDSSFDWDCILIGFTGTIEPNDGSNFYRSSGNLHIWDPNEPKPATPWEAEIDQLMDQGTAVMDPFKRAPYYWRIQEILHDQLPILEVVRQQRFDAWKNSIEGFQPTVWGMYKPEWIQFKSQ
jgi:peptide/nickel transport system substrate-binding protein